MQIKKNRDNKGGSLRRGAPKLQQLFFSIMWVTFYQDVTPQDPHDDPSCNDDFRDLLLEMHVTLGVFQLMLQPWV